jgi:hypothetical protein
MYPSLILIVDMLGPLKFLATNLAWVERHKMT